MPIPGPVGPDAIRNCVPMNVFGQGNVSQAAHDYAVSQKEGVGTVTQEFAEVLFTGDIWEGFGPGPFSMAGGLTYREQSFFQYGLPREIEFYGPPVNAPSIGIRGFPGGFTTGSANLHEFSTVPAIEGGYDVWEAFTEFNLPLWESDSGNQRLEIDVAGRHSDYSTSGGIVSHKTGINLQVAAGWRLRATVSRDVREPTFAERFNLQGGGGMVSDPLLPATAATGADHGDERRQPCSSARRKRTRPRPASSTKIAAAACRSPSTGTTSSSREAIGQVGAQNIVNGCAQGRQNLCDYVTRDANNVIGMFATSSRTSTKRACAASTTSCCSTRSRTSLRSRAKR